MDGGWSYSIVTFFYDSSGFNVEGLARDELAYLSMIDVNGPRLADGIVPHDLEERPIVFLCNTEEKIEDKVSHTTMMENGRRF